MTRKRVKNERRFLYVIDEPKSPLAESFRTLRTNLQFTSVDKDCQFILITSSTPGEGKSIVAANLGVVLAQAGKSVLIVDCDLRKPVQHKIFKLPNAKGLTSVLFETEILRQAANQIDVAKNLFVLTSGPIPPNPSELLGSKKMNSFLATLREQYDYVLIDSPPVLPVTDATILAPLADGVVLVTVAGVTRVDLVQTSKEQLENAGGHLLGVVLNKIKAKHNTYYYQYYHYYYTDDEELG